MLLKGLFECVISCYHRLYCYLSVTVEDAAEPPSDQLEKSALGLIAW